MGLKQVTIATYTVKAPGSDFAVRAITFAEIAKLATHYAPAAAMVFGDIVKRAQDRKGKASANVTTDEVKEIIRAVIPAAPDIVGAVIAMAADEFDDDGVDIANKLPINIQVEALENIFSMTFTSDAELKKLLESITRMLGGVTASVRQMRLPLSELGIGAFAGESASS